MRINIIILVSFAVLSLVAVGLVYNNTSDDQEVSREQSIYGSGFELTKCEQIVEKDIHELCLRIREDDSVEFDTVMLTNKFHGHIGPNNIYGAKMGLYAMELLGAGKHQMEIASEAGSKRPISCMNDGLTISTGNTPGWGGIEAKPVEEQKLAAIFSYQGKTVRLEVKSEISKISMDIISESLEKHGGLNDDYFKDVRDVGIMMWEDFDRDEMFDVTYVD